MLKIFFAVFFWRERRLQIEEGLSFIGTISGVKGREPVEICCLAISFNGFDPCTETLCQIIR